MNVVLSSVEVHIEGVGAGGLPGAELCRTVLTERVSTWVVHFEAANARDMARYRAVFRLAFPDILPLRVHHHSFPRLHREMTLPVDRGLGSEGLPRTGFASPGAYDLLPGHQDMALHNAFVVFQPGGAGVLFGPLTESRSKAGYSWKRIGDRVVEVAVEYDFPGLSDWPLAAGRSFVGESLYLEILPDPVTFGTEVFANYHAALRERGLAGRIHLGPNARHELFWGTWNEGIERQVDEALILREACWLAQNIPQVRWIQIDDGYETDADTHSTPAANLGGHWREEDAWCRRRFPRGMRALAEDIRALGLRPMIWFSPSCSVHSALYQSHPEYFIPNSVLHFETNLVFADYSRQEVRDITRRALDRLFVEWGFEGIKLDFWTYGFDQTRMTLSGRQATNVEWMQWLETEIRQRLPADGLMLSCLEPANGNPFRSRVWDQHRIGPDIGGVGPELMEEIAVWTAALVGLKETQRHFWIPEADGLSLFRHKDVPDATFRLFTAFMVATGTATELAGKLSEQTHDPRMPSFLDAVALVRFGQRVNCPGYDWTENRGRAPHTWVRHAEDLQRVVALTNWDACPRTVQVTAADLDCHPGAALREVFSGATASLPLGRTIGPHDAELWTLV
ncbi:MAG: alpha-galactosidase [Candidatus Methylacidiphilales bacterium]|nr:alpha-galactosidase [Candidatus Methylacidiphilales bacterium]